LVAKISSTEKFLARKQYFNFQKYATLNFWPERSAVRVSLHTPFWLLCASQFAEIAQYILAALCESVSTDCTILCTLQLFLSKESPKQATRQQIHPPATSQRNYPTSNQPENHPVTYQLPCKDRTTLLRGMTVGCLCLAHIRLRER